MNQQKKPSEMNDEEFEKYMKESKRQDLVKKYGLDELDKFRKLNLIDEDGNVIDEKRNIIDKGDV